MAESRNIVTTVSVVVAVFCAGWAVYATRHADKPSAFGPPGMSGPPGMGGPPGAGGAPGTGGAAGAGGGRPDSPGMRPGAGGGGGMPGGSRGSSLPTNVVSTEVRVEELSRELKALGTAAANEAVDITAKSSNIVKVLRFRDGQTVVRGVVLVELDSAQARADLAVAEAARTESQSLFNRSRELLSTQALSKSQFEQIDATNKANQARTAAARARLEDTVIRAPFSGRVGLRRVSVGSLVNPGAVITTLDDTSVVKVDFDVPENNLSALRAGLPMVAQSGAWPGRNFDGKVTSVDSRVDPSSRAVKVRAEVPNAEGLLKPGMFLNVSIQRDQRSALVVPEEALVPEQNKQFVFVAVEGRAQRREVRIGARRPGSVEILAGLAQGERVIVEGMQKVRDGGAIRDLAAGSDTAGPSRPPAAAAANARGSAG